MGALGALLGASRRAQARSGARDRRYRPAVQELEHRLALSPPGTGWTLAFEDNFDGPALDTSIWRVNTGPRRNAINTPDALSVVNGQLTITTSTYAGIHYTGFLDTRNSFLATFGYWEARVQYQGMPGMWSAFWMQSPTMGNPLFDPATAGTEIDITEHRRVNQTGGNVSNRSNIAIHWDGYGQYHQSTGTLANNPTGTPLQGNFHTYAVLWTPHRYTFFIDSRQVYTTTQAVSQRSEYILLSSEVQNNSWAGTIPAGGYGSLETSQAKMIVDWVRVWQRPLYGQDVGSVGRAGSDDLDEQGTWTVRGSGADIWGTADAFHFVDRPLSGNGWIFAQVSWVEATDPWAKAGVMIRETLAANSKHALLVVTPANGVSFQRRVSTGGSSTSDTLPGVSAPYGVYLERVGDDFNAWGTADYVTWDSLGTATIPMAAKVYVGLAVTSHNNGVLNTSVFDYVSTSLDNGGGSPGGDGGAPFVPGQRDAPLAAVDVVAALRPGWPVPLTERRQGPDTKNDGPPVVLPERRPTSLGWVSLPSGSQRPPFPLERRVEFRPYPPLPGAVVSWLGWDERDGTGKCAPVFPN